MGNLKVAAIISYLTIAFNILSGFLYTPWMIDKIGSSDYGLYTLATSVIAIFTLDFGIGAAVSRFIAKYKAENDEESISRFMGITYKLYIAIDIIILVALIIFYFFIDKIYLGFTIDELQKFKNIFCIVGLFTIISFPTQPFNGVLNADERFIFLNITSLLQKILTLVAMIFLLSSGYQLYSLVIINVFMSLLIIIIRYLYIKKNKIYTVNWKFNDKSILKEIFSFSMWTMVIVIAQRFIINIAPTILGITSTANEISIFSISLTIEGYIFMLSSAIGGLFMPRISKMVYSQNKTNHEEILELCIRIGRLQLFLVGAIVSIFSVVGQDFIISWLGEGFKSSYITTLLIILPSIFLFTFQVPNTVLTVVNKLKWSSLSIVTSAVISLILSFSLSYRLGAVGVALGIFFGKMLGEVLISILIFHYVLKLNMIDYFKRCHFSMFLLFLLIIITGFGLNIIITDINWFNTIIKIAILLLIYIIFSYFFIINKYEKNLILGIFKR